MANSIIIASILPPGRTTFFNADGTPLSDGQVFFYVPNTNTLKDTYQDPFENVLNANPVVLDAAGTAVIYGQGQYTMAVYDSLGNLIWTALTMSDGLLGTTNSLLLFLWCGTATGGPNTYSVSPNPALPGPTIPTGTPLAFMSSGTSGNANTGASTLTITNISASPIPIKKCGLNGIEALRGGEIYDGQITYGIYDGTEIVLLGNIRSPEGTTWCGTSSGSANAQVVTPAGLSSVDTGQMFIFQVGNGLTNTAAATIAFNGSPALNIYKQTPLGICPLSGGELQENQVALCAWDGTEVQLCNPYTGGKLTSVSGTVSPTLTNYSTMYVSSGNLTIDLPATNTIFSGYTLYGYAATGTITLVPNGAEDIDGSNSSVTIGNTGAFIIKSDGNGNWWLLQNSSPISATIPLRAFAVWNGNSDGTGTLVIGNNISSISNTGTGTYNVALSGGFAYTHGGAIETGSGSTGGNSTWGAASADITGTNPTFSLITNNAGGSGGERGNMVGFCSIMVFGE